MNKIIKFYTDGSCLDNAKRKNFGGFAVVYTINKKYVKIYKEGKKNTTNNEMEMMAVLHAIKWAKQLGVKCEIYSDSAYVVDTTTKWMFSWAARGWTKANKQAPKNLEIVKELYDNLLYNDTITIKKVRGHIGDYFNEMADAGAKEAAYQLKYETEKRGEE